MELAHLKYFYTVAREGSFTKASEALRVSQPAISRMVRNLEDSVGVPLLQRRPRGVTLTEAGQLFYARCEGIFSEIANLRQISSDLREDCFGELRLGASDNICNYLLPDIIRRYAEGLPRVSFRLSSGTSRAIKESLLADESELGLFYTPLTEPEPRLLEAREIARVPFVVIVAGKERRVKNRFDPVLFRRNLKYIGSRRSDYREQYPALKMHQLLGLEPTIHIETNNQETQKRMVMTGMGYSIVPLHMVSAEVQAGSLRIAKTETPLTSPLFLVKRRKQILSKQARLFADFLLTEAETLQGRPRSPRVAP